MGGRNKIKVDGLRMCGWSKKDKSGRSSKVRGRLKKNVTAYSGKGNFQIRIRGNCKLGLGLLAN